MADKKRFEATAELFLKTSNASKDAKKFADGIRQQLSNIENAADNFTVFQDLVGYIAQADKNLAALIANHKDEFKDMVSGLDKGLHNQYEEMFGVSGETLQKLDMLREKLATIKVGAKPEEVRKFVTGLNGLFTAVGSDVQLDSSKFSKKITQNMVDEITVAFGDFEKIIVDKVSNLKNNLNLGGIGIGSFSEDVQKELKGLSDQLSEAKSLKKELESTLSAINKFENYNKITLDTKPTEDFVKGLIKQYNDLEEASKNLINGTDEYYSNLTKRANIGMQLYAVQQQGLEFKNVDIGAIVDSEAFSKVQDELKSKSQEIFANLDQIIQTTQQKVQDFMTSLSSGSGHGGERQLLKTYEELLSIVDKLNVHSLDGLGLESDEIQSLIKDLKELYATAEQFGQVDNILQGIFAGHITFPDAFRQLATLFEIEFSESIQTAEDKVDVFYQKINNQKDVELKDEFSVGQYLSEMESLRNELQSLYEQGRISKDEFDGINEVFDTDVKGYVDAFTQKSNILKELSDLNKQASQTEDETSLKDIVQKRREILTVAQQNQTLLAEQLAEENAITDAIEKRIGVKKQEGEQSSGSNGEEHADDSSDTAQENEEHKQLLETIRNVKTAVEDKTRAFVEEQNTVDSVVNKEIESLGRLKEYLELLKETAQSIFSGKRQEIEFHAGDLDYYTKTGVRSEALGGSGAALASGYGAYGTGIYTVSNPNAYLKNKDNWSGAGSKIYAIDTTAYNRFVAQTSEQAEQLYNFLAKLEKFTLASSGYQEFNDELNGVDINSLYADMQNVFKNTAMPLERFQKFIDDAKQLISMVGIDKLDNIKLGDLNSILAGDNVATQWMRLLGYQGVSVKGTKYDNTTVGSVTYDLDQSNAYIKAFDTIDEAIEFYNQHLTQTNSIQSIINNSVEQWQNGLASIKETLSSISGSVQESASSMQSMADKLSEMVNNAQTLRNTLDGTDSVIVSGETGNSTTKVTVPSANSDNATKTVPIGDAIDSADITTETAQLQNLLDILNQVKNAVDSKTKAFEEEYVTVDAAVQLEIDALNRLKESLITIQSLIQSIFNGNIAITGDVETIGSSVRTNTMSTSLSTIEKTLGSIYGVLQGFTGIQAENKNSVQYKGTSSERQVGVQSLNDAANTLNNAANNIIEMIQGPDGVLRAASDSANSSNDAMQLADTAQQTQNSLVELGIAAQNTSNYLDSVSGGSGGGSSNDDSNGGASSSDGGYALEKTLQQTNSILNRIASGSSGSSGTSRGSASKTTYGTGAITTAEAKNNALWKTLNSNDKLLQSGKIDAAVRAYTQAFEELKKQYADLQNSEDPTEQQKEGFIEAKTNCSNLRQEVEKLVKSYNTATTGSKVIGYEPLKNFGNRQNELLDYVKGKYKDDVEIGNFNAAYTELSYTIKNADGSFTDAKVSVNSLGTAITETAGKTQQSVGVIGSVVESFKGKWQQLGSYLASVFSWRALAGQVKQGVAYVREIDSALTELKKVTDETSATYDKFLQTMSKTASQTGSTVKDLTSSASDWARLGYSLEESGELAATTAKLLNVSEFTSVEDATSALVSSLQAFTTEGQDVGQRAEEIVDVLNNIGKCIA